jgi:hypothetical protein
MGLGTSKLVTAYKARYEIVRKSLLVSVIIALGVFSAMFVGGSAIYLGLRFVIGSPGEFFRAVFKDSATLRREAAADALASRGYSLSPAPVEYTRMAADKIVLSGQCLDADGNEHAFQAEFVRAQNNNYESARLLIDGLADP